MRTYYTAVINPVIVIILFVFILGAIMECLGSTNSVLTTEERLAKLEETVNSDENLRAVYHGGKPKHFFVTNSVKMTVKRLDKYPDGYVHTIPGKTFRILTPESEAKRKTATKRAQLNRIDNLKRQIESLSSSTNATDLARLAQCRRLLERLERSSVTNTVDITFKPKRGNKR